MKQFSQEEKQLIYSIYQAKDSNNYVLANIFNRWLFGEQAVGFDFEKNVVLFDFSRNPSVDDTLDIQKDIIHTALLVKYLEQEGYIYLIDDNATVNKPTTLGPSFKQSLSVSLPPDIMNIISRTTCRVYVSYALIQLVENDFKTYEELQLIASNSQLETSSQQLSASEAQLEEARQQTEEAKAQTNEAKEQTSEAKKQTKKSTGTFVLSGLTFLASLIIPFIISKCNGDKVYHENVMTGIAQIDTTINETTNKITNHLDTIVWLERKSQNNDANIIQILNKQERHLKDINKQLKSR